MPRWKKVEERFWDRVKIGNPNSCWVWTGMKSRLGYGYMYYKNKKRTSCHRISLFIHGIKIPKGKHVDHLCRNTSCVNPKHLEVVSPRENILRGIGITSKNFRKTHCKYGHKLSGKNLMFNKRVNSRNNRVCRKCTNSYYHRKIKNK